MVVFSCILHAEDFTHSFHVDNTKPYVKEAVILTLELNQTNPNKVLMFDFDLVKSNNYSFQRLDMQETDDHQTKGLHAVHVKYTYLVYPLTHSEVNIHFNLTKKVTTDDSVAYSFSGDRDNVKGLVTKDYQINLPNQHLHVKPLPKDTQLIGDFTLNHTIKKHQAKAYEALPLQVTLKGKGYPPVLDTLLPTDVNFTLFTEKPMAKTIVTTEGSHSTVTYPMALSHSKSFTLSEVNLKAFNPKTEKSYKLTIPTQTFDITEVPKTQLVDKTNTPPRLSSNWEWIQTLLGYLVVFVAGYCSALVFKWQKKSTLKEVHPLIEKINACKESKALLQLLMATDAHRFAPCIEKLENSLYQNAKINISKINLSKVKKEAIDLI